MPDTLDVAVVRLWCHGGLAALRAHQHEIDELNVYPVPDGDTGTNLVLTLTSAQEALEDLFSEESIGFSEESIGRIRSEERIGRRVALSQDENPPQDGDAPQDSDAPRADDKPATSDGAESGSTSLGRAMRRMARGALLGARGNSGVIVSQILRGMADSFATAAAIQGAGLAAALRAATDAAYQAVAQPVEGTVLSVVAAAADAAAGARSNDLVAVARAAARAAGEALARTPQQLPALARAGVVDAGGRGLCLLLDALVEAMTADVRPVAVEAATAGVRPAAVGAMTTGLHAVTDQAASNGETHPRPDRVHAGAGRFGYEVQYLLDAEARAVDALRTTLAGLGDSLVIVGTSDGSPPTWNVHVHVAAAGIGPAMEAGITAGRPHRVSVTPLDVPDSDHAAHRATAPNRRLDGSAPEPSADTGPPDTGGPDSGRPDSGRPDTGPPDSGRPDSGRPDSGRPDTGQPDGERDDDRERADRTSGNAYASGAARGVVVSVVGDGFAALLRAEGATVVGHNPSTRDLLDAITATGCRRVVLLPNDPNTQAVAASAAREAEQAGIRVSVVPTRSPVQALAALAVRDPARPFTDEVIAMAEAAGACRYGQVCRAQRPALTVAGPCRAGDLLGLVDGEVHVIGTDLADVSRRLIDRMLGGGGELATLVFGADAPSGLDQTLGAHLAKAWPFVELQCYAGGQPRYHLLIGVE